MKAISTRYISPTSTRHSKIRAHAEGCSGISIEYDDNLSEEAIHLKAAEALVDKMEWNPKGDKVLIGGGTKEGMVWVFVPVIKTWLCSFYGREMGAEGIYYRMHRTIESTSKDAVEARLILQYEGISGLDIREVPIKQENTDEDGQGVGCDSSTE